MSTEQALEALKHGNTRRLERSTLRRQVAAMPRLQGRDAVAHLLLDQPACLSSMTVPVLLAWPQRNTVTSAAGLLSALPWPTRISEMRLVGTLVERERKALAAALTSPQRVLDLVAEIEAEKRAAA